MRKETKKPIVQALLMKKGGTTSVKKTAVKKPKTKKTK
jgi:hypothetical protein